MGKGQADDMEFWTKEEFDTFIEHMMDKHTSYLAFSTLIDRYENRNCWH